MSRWGTGDDYVNNTVFTRNSITVTFWVVVVFFVCVVLMETIYLPTYALRYRPLLSSPTSRPATHPPSPPNTHRNPLTHSYIYMYICNNTNKPVKLTITNSHPTHPPIFPPSDVSPKLIRNKGKITSNTNLLIQ